MAAMIAHALETRDGHKGSEGMTMGQSLGIRPYDRGLHDLGNGIYAWLQPDGGWGWSNAGLVVDGDESLLVDTLFDLKLTEEMLAAMRKAAPVARDIGQLVNTHSNGDHCNCNYLVVGSEIISSSATAEEMDGEGPARLAEWMRNADQMGEVGAFFKHCFGAFDFEGITQTLPTKTFDREMQTRVGDKVVELVEVGPAHTRGDILVHVPSDGVVFTGDILFVEGHPIIWAGPVQNWIDACDRIDAMEPELVVPGHGPITDLRGVKAVRDYLIYVRDEARKRFDAGLGAYDAAMDIALDDFDGWGDAERIVVNVVSLYREFSGGEAGDRANVFEMMARIKRDRRL